MAPDAKGWLIGKDPVARKDWGRGEKGATEDEMLDGITDSMDMSLSQLQETVKNKETEPGMTEWLNNTTSQYATFQLFGLYWRSTIFYAEYKLRSLTMQS